MFRKNRSRYAKERDEYIKTLERQEHMRVTRGEVAKLLHGKDFYERVCKEFYRSGLERRREMRKKR
jgi:hypothetical protein